MKRRKEIVDWSKRTEMEIASRNNRIIVRTINAQNKEIEVSGTDKIAKEE